MEQNVFIFGNSPFVTHKFLLDRKVPEDFIYSSTSKKNKERWQVQAHPNSRKLKIISYDSIPYNIIQKYNLPLYPELKDIAQQIEAKIKKEKQINVSRNIKIAFDLEYSNWQEIVGLYKNQFLDNDRIEMFCKTHLLLSKSIELYELGMNLRDIYNGYYQYSDLIFQTDNYNSFCNKIRKLKKSKRIEDELIHGLSKHTSNNHKMSEDVIIEIIKWYKDPKNYNAGQITEFVNDYLTRMNRQNISRSSVEKIISQPYVKNACMISRHGDVYAENKLLPFARFKKPEAEGILWCMDGSKFQFAYKLGNSKFNYLTYFIIIDGCSDKIIGYSNDDSENHVMVIDAFEKACLTTGYLPREIIADDSPAYRAKEFTQIVSHIKNWGVNYRQIMRNNPRDNSYAERFFGVLQESYCKKIDGYIGDGIKSKNQNGRPAPEELKKFCSLKKIRTKQELIEIIESTLLKYNIDKDKKKRNENDYTNGKKKKFQPIQLNTIKYVQLFWNQNELTIHNSSITFDINKVNYCYNIYDGEKVKKYNGIKVLVRYNKADLSKIMIFNLKYDTYITTLDRLPTISKGSYERDSEQNSNLYRHSKRKKELKSKLLEGMKKIDEISQKNRESLPPELTEFTSVSKYQKEATENSILNEEMNKLLGAVNFKRIENNKEGDDSKNIYKQKGNLKRFTYGNN